MKGLEAYVGRVLDEKYRLERLLGQGGMGAVYLATHLGTDRFVALKLIAPQFMRNEEFVERFKREARAAGRLRHPNVVDVTDFGFARADAETLAYLVMEYLDGCTLGDVLSEEGRLPLDWAVDILEQVCSAVHEAHQQGIVHRDLKPDNIWLEPNRLGGYRVKVLDFGIA
ncbi:MAG: serine/threonine protein kinase, partial [Acidobacteria bacterium]|nr:serine/threonine protein kinase [Acidobacteriota bacterium]